MSIKKRTGKVVSNPSFGQRVGNLGAGYFNYGYESPEEWASIANSQNWHANQPSPLPTYNERGLPESWDWRTSRLGPNNEPLPPGAESWTPIGRPNFGVDLDGLWRSFTWKLFASDRNVRPTADQLKDNFDTNFQAQQQKALKATTPGQLASPVGGVLGSAFGTILQSLGNIWSGMEEFGGNEFNVLNAAPRVIGAAFDTVFYGLEAWDRVRKEHLVVPRLLQLEEVLSRDDLVPEETMQGWKKWLGALAIFPMSMRAGAAAIIGKIEWDDLEITSQNNLASKLGYTAFKDSAVKEEFLRQVRAGEDPRLLAMELQSPFYEMVSDLITDPFTYIGIGTIKRVLGAGGEISKVRYARQFAQPMLDVLKQVDELQGAAKLSKIDELKRLISSNVKDVAAEQVEQAGQRGFLHRLMTARQSELTDAASDTIGHILAATRGDPDQAMRITSAMTMLIDPNTAEAGLKLLNESIASYGDISRLNIFSPDGIKTAMLFNEIDGARVAKLIETAAGDLEELNRLFAKDLAKIVERKFPTVQVRIKVEDDLAGLVAKHGDESDEVQNFVAKNPLAQTPVPSIYRKIAPVYDTAQKYFYRPVGAFQGTVFMGMNPAYFFRNKIGNFAPIFVDQGVMPAVKSLFTPFSKQNALRELNQLLGRTKATRIAAEQRGIGAAGSFNSGDWIKGKLNFFAKSAADDEAIMGVHAMLPPIRRTMDQAVRPDRALSGIRDILTNDADIRLFTKLSKKNKYDMRATFLEYADKRGLDTGRTLSFLNERQLYHLDELQLTDQVRSIVENADLDAAGVKRALDDMIDEWTEAGDEAAREGVIHNNPDIIEAIEPITDQMSDEASQFVDLFERKLHEGQMWTDAADYELQQAVQKLRNEYANRLHDHLKAAGRDPRDAASMANKMVDDFVERARTTVDETIEKTRKRSRQMREDYWEFSRKSNSMDPIARVKLYERLNLGPKGIQEIGAREFRDLLWEAYRRRQTNLWHKYRKTHVFENQRSIDELYQILNPGGTGLDEGLRNATRRQGVNAELLQRSQIDDDGLAYVNIYPSELDDLLVHHYSDVLGRAQNVDPRTMARPAEAVLDRITEWRDEVAEGRQTVQQIIDTVMGDIGDPQVQEAMMRVAGVRGRVPEMMRSLLSERPDPQRLVDQLTNNRVELTSMHPTSHGVLTKIDDIDSRLEELGTPAKSIDDSVPGTAVVSNEGVQGLVVGRASDTAAGNPRFRVRLQNGEVVTRTKSGFRLAPKELEKAAKVDQLREAQAALEEVLKTTPDDVPKHVQDLLSEYDRRIQTAQQRVPQAEVARPVEEGVEAAVEAAAEVAEEVPAFRRPVVSSMDEATPTPARFKHAARPAAKQILEQVKQGVDENWGKLERKVLTPEQERQFAEMMPGWERNVADARFVAEKTGAAARDFALHNYGNKYGFDLVLGLVFPYQFWYSRSYAKWMRRLATEPGILTAYARYRRTLEQLHSGLPEWWKYQLNTNELLGLDSEHPFYFNLESMLNPLHGLTGVDFTDPKRRLDWWGSAVEDIQKYGPSVWAPYQWALALHYNNIGEEDAAARWAGRLLPFSRPLRDVTALVDPKGLGVEIDPAVNWFGGGSIFGNLFGGKAGIEPYERARVGRQLGMMVTEGKYPVEDIIEGSYQQTGEIWDLAHARAINDRAPNFGLAVTPFLFGAAGKPRNAQDIQIDQMYNQVYSLRANKPNLSPEEYRQQWSNLREHYPFFDTVLMSKRIGLDRDEALAWNVLSRIPPGMTDEVAERLGIDESVITQFYDTKGDLKQFNDANRMQFMGAILEAGSLMALPNNATSREWDLAREQYRALVEMGEVRFGEDIWDLVDVYFAQRDPENPDAGRQFLKANPIVEQALDFKQLTIQNTPLLATYYTSVDRIEMFYKQQMYDLAERLFGEDLWNKFDVYGRLKEMGETKAAREYWKDNPQLAQYMNFKEEQLPLIDDHVQNFARLIPEPKGPFYRDEELKLIPGVPQYQSFNVDAQEAQVTNEVLSYSQAYSNYSAQRQDVKDYVRAQADSNWPGTRAAADRYYRIVDENPIKATELLQANAELEARVRWEFERILRLSLAREQEFVAAGADRMAEIQEFGGAPEQSFEAILPQIDPDSPLGRLIRDPEGIPLHLLEAYGNQ